MSSNPLRIGFVGVGRMGQCAHLRHYASLNGCQVTAVAEMREQTRQAVAQRYGIKTVYNSAADMLAAEDLDAIVASQPFERHGLILAELIKADLPIFIEKPLASSIQVGRQILEQLGGSGSKVMVGYQKRSDPATIHAKAEIDRLKASGDCGSLRYVRLTMPPGDWIYGGFTGLINPDEPTPELSADPAPDDMDETAYGQYLKFLNYYIHQVNLLRHLLGEDYRVTFADPSGVLFVGESESGTACLIEMATYNTTRSWDESAMVCFKQGYVRLALPAPLEQTRAGTVEVFRDPGGGAVPVLEQPVMPAIPAMRQQAANFLAFARGDAPATCDAAEAIKDLLIAKDYIDLMKGGA